MTIMREIGHFPTSENHETFMRYLTPILDDVLAAGRRPEEER